MKPGHSLSIRTVYMVGLSAISLTALAATAPQTPPRDEAAERNPPNCKSCQTVPLEEAVYGYFPGGEIDDCRIQWLVVGSKHTCSRCGGELKVVKGTATSDMKANCPVCAKAVPSCCRVSG